MASWRDYKVQGWDIWLPFLVPHRLMVGRLISEVRTLLYWKGKLSPCPVHRTYSGETIHEKLRPWEAY